MTKATLTDLLMYEAGEASSQAEIRELKAKLAAAERAISGHYESEFLILIIAKIREAAGVGMGPMLSELPEAIADAIQKATEGNGV
jgi:hypothetical protein